MKQYIVPIEINGLSICLRGLPDGETLFIVALQFGDRGHELGTPFMNSEFPNGVLEKVSSLQDSPFKWSTDLMSSMTRAIIPLYQFGHYYTENVTISKRSVGSAIDV